MRKEAKKANKLLDKAGAQQINAHTVCQQFEGMAHKSIHDLNMPKWQLESFFLRSKAAQSKHKATKENGYIIPLDRRLINISRSGLFSCCIPLQCTPKSSQSQTESTRWMHRHDMAAWHCILKMVCPCAHTNTNIKCDLSKVNSNIYFSLPLRPKVICIRSWSIPLCLAPPVSFLLSFISMNFLHECFGWREKKKPLSLLCVSVCCSFLCYCC